MWERVLNPYQKNSAVQSPLVEFDNVESFAANCPWKPEIAGLMRSEGIEGLYFNREFGWECQDFDFLRELPWLRLLNIYDPMVNPAPDLSVVERLTSLTTLSVGPSSTRIDFSGLPLQRCYLKWWPEASNIFQCQTLKSLSLAAIKHQQLAELPALVNLERLRINSGSLQNLEAIAPLTNLKILELLDCRRLENLNGIENLRKLTALRVSGSNKIYDFDSLAPLSDLEYLAISDSFRIRSLSFVTSMTKLRALAFAGTRTSVEDGDLSPLTGLPQLSMLMFGPRRHYSHRLVKKWNWNNYLIPDVLLQKK